MGVGEVHPRARDLDQHLPVPRLGLWDVDHLEDLGAAELVYLNRSHEAGSVVRGRGPRIG